MMYEYKSDCSVEELDGTNKPIVYSSMGQKLKSVIPHDYFNEKFLKSDQASAQFDKAVDALKDNPELLSYMLTENNAELRSLENSLLAFVNSFGTRGIDASALNLSANALRMHSKINKIASKGNNLTIEFKDGSKINSMVLSRTLGWENDELETLARMNKDKEMSIQIARALPFESKVVTGKVAGLTSKTSYLHTWVEAMVDGKLVVIDYTMNSIMNKSGYETLREAEPIAAISSSDLAEDKEKIAPLINAGELSILEYLIYRDKIMEAINESEQ